MKTKLSVIALVAMLAGSIYFGSGCRTVTSTEVINGTTNQVTRTELDPERMAGAIRAVIPAGVAIAIDKDPNSEAYLRATAVVLRAVVERGEYDPAQVERTLDTISVKELRTTEAKAVIAAALGMYRAYVADVVSAKLEGEAGQWVRPVLKAIADGLWDSLPANAS